jgi:hypothetical protein
MKEIKYTILFCDCEITFLKEYCSNLHTMPWKVKLFSSKVQDNIGVNNLFLNVKVLMQLQKKILMKILVPLSSALADKMGETCRTKAVTKYRYHADVNEQVCVVTVK